MADCGDMVMLNQRGQQNIAARTTHDIGIKKDDHRTSKNPHILQTHWSFELNQFKKNSSQTVPRDFEWTTDQIIPRPGGESNSLYAMRNSYFSS